jgi:dihydrofolate reductase
MKPIVSIIAALSENNVIGKNNKLPWHISEDLKRFKQLTLHHPVIMGRKTFVSIGKPLPGRTNIVITRDENYKAEDVTIVHSLKEALNVAKEKAEEEIFIIGGAQIFEQTIKVVDKLYLTLVKGNFDGDAYFPDYSAFSKIVSQQTSRDQNYSYTFLDLTK